MLALDQQSGSAKCTIEIPAKKVEEQKPIHPASPQEGNAAMKGSCLTVRLLPPCAGTATAKLLGLAPTGVGDEEGTVVRDQSLLKFEGRGGVFVLGVEPGLSVKSSCCLQISLPDLCGDAGLGSAAWTQVNRVRITSDGLQRRPSSQLGSPPSWL